MKCKKSVQEMKPYNPPISGRKGYLRLDFNENTVGPSKAVVRALKNINREQLSIYPEYTKLRKALAKFTGVKFNEIMPTNASDEGIKLVFDTFLEKEDEIIIPTPTFTMFRFYAQLAGAKIKSVLYNKNLSFPTEKVLKNITKKTKLIVLVNPNNPTGTSIPRKDIIKIIKKAKNSIVLIDEAYFEYFGETCVNLINKYKNIIILRTFSKAFGLAGLRLGYIISCKENMKSLLRASSPYSVNKIASICAITAMKDKEYVKNYVKEIKKSKQILYYGLKCLKIPFYESDTNFVVANFGNNCDYVYNKLKKKGILVRNISKYPLLSGCLRIGIGTKEQTRQLINALDEINYAYLFDIDGVLVDVSDSYRVAIKKTAEYFLKEKISYNEIASFKNIPGYNNDWDLTEAIIRKRKVTVDKKKIINKFQELYGNLVENEKWILDKKLLKQLSKKYKLGIITGRPKKEAECVLKRFKADKFFQIIIAMEDAAQKPNPAGINLALKKLKATTGLYIGDTINDVMAANNAGINYIDINELDEVLRNQRFLVPRKEVLK